jgi:D-amino peptidase
MKLLISSDIEGTSGICHWDEATIGKPGYEQYREYMTREAAAACRGALAAGAQVIIRDGHDSARNLIASELPRGVEIVRGWAGGPNVMMDGIDEGVDAAAFTGYHSPAHGDGNPLSHTMTTSLFKVTMNGKPCSEFLFNAMIAAAKNIPVLFLSGDAALCTLAKAAVPGITTVATKKGIGNAVISLQPEDAVEQIEKAMKQAVEKFLSDREVLSKKLMPEMPSVFEVSVQYKQHQDAYHYSFYPGAELSDECTVKFCSKDFEALKCFFLFCL